MNIVKIDHDPSDHGNGRPIIYHPHTNTAYVGVPGGYHENLADQMQRLNVDGGPGPHNDYWKNVENWRLGPDGLLDFYDFGGLTPKTTPEQRQEAIQALRATGEHKYVKGDTSWYFGSTLGDPPIPETPEEYHKAVTINGQHHVFPGEISHLDRVRELGMTPHDVEHYWGWNPYNDKWESFNRFQQDYRDVWDEMNPDERDQAWNMPTFSKTAEHPETISQPQGDIRDLLSPEPRPGVYQKGIESADGERWFWVPDERGNPHHPEVAMELGLTGPTKFLEVEENGEIEDAYGLHNLHGQDWG